MAVVDPYSPCPCGSEKKYKWCCQKVEPYVERAHRLMESGQHEAAVAALDEGLAKSPDSPWILLRKAIALITQQKLDEAKRCAARVLDVHPGHLGAAILLIRLELSTGGAVAAVSQLQRTLSRTSSEMRPRLVRLVAVLGEELARHGHVASALKHLALARALGTEEDAAVASTMRSVRSSPTGAPWLKDDYTLTSAPETLAGPRRDEFQSALSWADAGLWEAAASAFELLTADSSAGLAAERNLALCRLWLADEKAAAVALRRWLEKAPETSDAVDLAVLCQTIEEIEDPEPIEQVRLTWPLRDREAFLKLLSSHDRIVEDAPRQLDPDDDDSPELPFYHLLDRPKIAARPGLDRKEIPLVLADVLVGQDTVMLEAMDEGKLSDLIDQFIAISARAVPPAHPKTKGLQRIDRGEQAMSWHWYLPPDLSAEEKLRLNADQVAYLTGEVWPRVPLAFLGHRTPLQAAPSGKQSLFLRGAVLGLELAGPSAVDRKVDWPGLRQKLGVPSEPAIDPDTVDIQAISVVRLCLVPIDRLDDDRLVAFYRRAADFGMMDLALGAAKEIGERGRPVAEGKVDAVELYRRLALAEVRQGKREPALGFVTEGRTAQPADQRRQDACRWDMLELQLKIHLDDPEDWVPELVGVLERYRGDQRASTEVTSRLLELGLVEFVSPPDRPGELMLDTSALQHLVARYGPKVASASGYVGVSATKGEIWTPASESKGSSIWTPGSDAAPSGTGEKPRLIVPG